MGNLESESRESGDIILVFSPFLTRQAILILSEKEVFHKITYWMSTGWRIPRSAGCAFISFLLRLRLIKGELQIHGKQECLPSYYSVVILKGEKMNMCFYKRFFGQ